MQSLSRREMIRSFGVLAAATAVSSIASRIYAEGPTTSPVEEPPRDPGFATNPVSSVELAPGISVLQGPGGNITVLKGADGPVVVDTGIPPRANDVLAAIKQDAGGPPVTVVNTHWHFDHVGGNLVMANAGAAITAHDNTLVRMSGEQKNTVFHMVFPPSDPKARPTLTFDDKLTLRRKGEVLAMAYVPPAHTDSDIAIHFQNANVLVCGDLFFNGFYPFVDYDSAGSIEGMVGATEILLKMGDDKTKYVPGHGAIGTRAELQSFHDMLVEVQSRLTKLASQGVPLADVQAQRPLKDLDAVWGQRMMHGSNVIHMIYPHLVGAK